MFPWLWLSLALPIALSLRSTERAISLEDVARLRPVSEGW